jgi:hypothetical protein
VDAIEIASVCEKEAVDTWANVNLTQARQNWPYPAFTV